MPHWKLAAKGSPSLPCSMRFRFCFALLILPLSLSFADEPVVPGKVIDLLSEKQFSNLFKKAARKTGVTGEILFQLLESRLDNIIYRFGIAPSRRCARQLVTHGHVTVNGKKVNIPSYQLKPNDIIALKEKSKSIPVVTDSININSNKFHWLQWDQKQFSGKLIELPARADIPENINEQSIVEFYSK